MANSIFIKADELAKELDISQGLAYKMIAQWNEELKAKGYTTVGGRVSRRYYQEKIYVNVWNRRKRSVPVLAKRCAVTQRS